MSLLKFAQNVEYLIKIGVPPDVAPELLAFLKTYPEDVKWMLAKIKDNRGLSMEQYGAIYHETKERNSVDPRMIEWAEGVNETCSKWLIRLAKAKIVRMGQDDDKLRAMLRTFEVVKERELIPIDQRDINKYKNDQELYDVIKPFLMMGQTSEILIPEDAPGLKYSANGIQILEVFDYKEAGRFAAGTNWCVKGDAAAQMYLKQGPLYFVFVDNQRSVLLHIPSNQIKETNDAPLRNFSIIRRINAPLEELGLLSPDDDFKEYREVLEEGTRVNAMVDKAMKNGGDISVIFGKLFPDVEKQREVLLYLENQYIEQPAVQKLCVQAFVPALKKNLLEIYRDLPRNIQLIPEIFETSRVEFIKEILENPGNYSECSNDLKKRGDIQKARFDGYVQLVFKDPKTNENNIPEEFRKRPELLKARYDGYVLYVRKHPDTFVPPDIDRDPQIMESRRLGWLEKLDREPYSYIRCPPEIKQTDQAYEIVWDACVREITKDPENFNSEVPEEFREDHLLYELYVKRWIDRIRQNPLYIFQCPDDLKELPAFKNAYSRDADEIDNFETATSEDILRSAIDNWVKRIQFRLDDYKLVPPDMKSRPEIQQAALQGWVDRVDKNPHQINYCPPEFKKRPEVREMLYKRNPQMRALKEKGQEVVSWYRLAVLVDPEVAAVAS